MKKLKPFSLILLTLFLFGSFQTAMAQDCVELDIEFPAEASSGYGGVVNGFFELVNCGDEADTIWVKVEVEIVQMTITMGIIPFNLGAGDIVSREIWLPTPPAILGDTVAVCVTAYAGFPDSSSALASECATIYIPDVGGDNTSGGSKSFGATLASADNCVEVELELPDTVTNDPASFVEGYFELTNCGDEADTIELSVSIELFDTAFSIPGPVAILGAGETISREFRFPVPPAVVPGSYVFCVTATAGEATATSCQTVVVVQGEGPSGAGTTQNYPNPFNPSTNIYFELPLASHVNLSIYNVLGQHVTTLRDDFMTAGSHVVEWDGTNEAGNRLSSGIYFYRLATGDNVQTKKMLMVK